ncbi:unnamed protein product [Caenorhabditis brenneri]
MPPKKKISAAPVLKTIQGVEKSKESNKRKLRNARNTSNVKIQKVEECESNQESAKTKNAGIYKEKIKEIVSTEESPKQFHELQRMSVVPENAEKEAKTRKTPIFPHTSYADRYESDNEILSGDEIYSQRYAPFRSEQNHTKTYDSTDFRAKKCNSIDFPAEKCNPIGFRGEMSDPIDSRLEKRHFAESSEKPMVPLSFRTPLNPPPLIKKVPVSLSGGSLFERIQHSDYGDRDLDLGVYSVADGRAVDDFLDFNTIEIPDKAPSSYSNGNAEKIVQKKPSAHEGLWNPIQFCYNNLYNGNDGIVFSRSECEQNIKKLTKNFKYTDYYPFLEQAAGFHGKNKAMEELALGQAFTTITLNKVMKSLRSSEKTADDDGDSCDIVKGIGFDLRYAERNEEVVLLPSQRCFKISETVTPYEASKWSSENFYDDCRSLFKVVIKTVALHDSYFPVFCANSSSNCGYLPVGEDFYRILTKYAIRGFHQTWNKSLETSLTCLARDTLTNILDQFRKEYKSHSTTTTRQLTEHLKRQLEAQKMSGEPILIVPLHFKDPNPVHKEFQSVSRHPTYKKANGNTTGL